MSYCRFSSDDWKSEVYCYEHCNGGFMVHVAGNRITSHVPPVPSIDDENSDAWLTAHEAQMAAVGNATRAPIGLPHDGETIVFATAGECADGLEALLALGYYVPQRAIDQLREEAKCSSAT
jgi:hypothetical protein